MNVIFVHGWSVHSHETYGKLPIVLRTEAAKIGINIKTVDLKLGRYISFDDDIEMRDLTRAFHQAIADQIPGNKDRKKPFVCITHSTGGPLVRCWLDEFYHSTQNKQAPITHLITLAAPHHGSALAVLGKKRVGRIKAFFEGIEPGKRILNWLELASLGQRTLNEHFFKNPKPSSGNPFLFSITGQTIDSKLYDHLNSYTDEPGSDGVVRVAAANLNFRWLTLAQTDEHYVVQDFQNRRKKRRPKKLAVSGKVKTSPQTALRIIDDSSHSGPSKGIMAAVNKPTATNKPILKPLLEALQVSTTTEYNQLSKQWTKESKAVQDTERVRRKKPTDQYSMVVFSLFDHEDNPLEDFDIYLLGGAIYDPDVLPKGFFRDRQKNTQRTNAVVYYVNHKKFAQIPDNKVGILIRARPDKGLVHFTDGEWHSDNFDFSDILRPNETIYIDIKLKRNVDIETTRLDPMSELGKSFKRTKPSGNVVEI